MAKKKGMKLIANNKKAFHDYFIEDTYEAGIALAGTEVKSLRMGKCSIKESFIRVENGEVYIYGMHISPYEKGNIFNKDPLRIRKLLLNRYEINKIEEKIKEKQEEMVALIAENAKEGSYTDEFDERYRKIAEEISTLKEEQIETRRKKKLADNYEQRLRDMDSFLQSQTCQIPEFDNDLVRRLIANIKVVSADKLIIQFQQGIVMEQEIS